MYVLGIFFFFRGTLLVCFFIKRVLFLTCDFHSRVGIYSITFKTLFADKRIIALYLVF